MTEPGERLPSGVCMSEQPGRARTWLFVPGDRPDRFAKGEASGADVVILDLEDAVRAGSKAAAREHVAGWLDAGHGVAVRVNGAGTSWFADDLSALAARPPLAVLLPKAEEPDAVREVRARVDAPVLPIVETARGMLSLSSTAGAGGICRLAFGTHDFAADIGVDPASEEALSFARASLVLASRAHGLDGPVDGPTRGWDDPALVERAARHARTLGFTGQLCIHPAQVAPVLRGLAPPPAQVAWAAEVAAAAGAGGVVRVGSEMVDQPVLDRARRILDDARAAGAS